LPCPPCPPCPPPWPSQTASICPVFSGSAMKYADITGSTGVYETCEDEQSVGGVPLTYFVVGLIEILCSLFFIITIINRAVCRMWKPAAISMFSYMLPIYMGAVVGLVALLLITGLLSITGVFSNNQYYFMSKVFILRAISESLSVFLLQPGIGAVSARRSVAIGLTWTLISVSFVLLLYVTSGFRFLLIGSSIVLMQLLIFYILIFVLPLQLLPRRPALRWFSFLSILVLTAQLLCLLSYIGIKSQHAACAVELSFALGELAQVVHLVAAFALDSRFWQGLYVDLKGDHRLNEPLLGIWDMDRELVRVVTDSVMQLERKVVTIIPFSQLRLDTRYIYIYIYE
jgi:hypothetical protein